MKMNGKSEAKGKRGFISLILALVGLVFLGGALTAQQSDRAKETEPKKKEEKAKAKAKVEKEPVLRYEMTVTATATKKETFETPRPVSVVTAKKIEESAPNNVTDLMSELPGVDTVGVGANQSRPAIRGLRGQRILLLEDGIRMNNSRRQQDFGEIPALVDISGVSRVEVVRGPASVLYGSDAIGGVINIITKVPEFDAEGTAIYGNLGYRYSSADSQSKGTVNALGKLGKLSFRLSGNYRETRDYLAPAGTFGEIRLAADTPVNDSGVQDSGINLFLDYGFSQHSHLSFKYEYYQARDAGFGYVDPASYDPGAPKIQILYPSQRVDKYTLKYQNHRLDAFFADHLSITGYTLENRRDLEMNIFVPFGIPGFPDAGVDLNSTNFTDVDTLGFRLELRKVLFKDHVFTYGVDYVLDDTFNTDVNTSQVVGFGPSVPVVDETPDLPNARYRSFGFFAQDDMPLSRRSSLILGLRYQNVNARTKETVGLEDYPMVDSTDSTVVGAANFIHRLTDNLNLFFALGRGFRSPNLIERFYNGLTPEGSGFQTRNLDLKAETSLNVDIGFRYRLRNLHLESSYFWNTIYDGIRVVRTGGEVNGVPEYRNKNIDRLRIKGLEILGRLYFKFGLSLTANFTRIESKDLGNPEMPYTDTFSSKFNLDVRYESPGSRFWAAYHLRHHGDQKDVYLEDNPIGEIIPGFTVHSLSLGVKLFKNSPTPMRVGIVVANLTDTLYSEFANASFFRPAPRRHIVLTWSMDF